jgi:non-ribosomal peptide synthetase component F
MEQGITFAAMAPSMLTYLRPYFDEIKADQLKTCILTAEACPVDLIEDWYKCATNTEIYDFYGPTEGTIYCTYYKLNRNGNNLSANGIISIGKPLDNVTAIIIDEKGNILNTDEKGELCISGDQITKGYWNNPEKNKTAFITIPGKQETYYRTGDLCQTLPDGNILYYGRIDQQAKIQGYRVELGEIEYQAATHLNNQYRTIAITYQTLPGLDQIALFIESEPIETAPLIKHLENTLPHYMLPATIKFIPQLPLNNSQKIDRIALKKQLNQAKTTE